MQPRSRGTDQSQLGSLSYWYLAMPLQHQSKADVSRPLLYWGLSGIAYCGAGGKSSKWPSPRSSPGLLSLLSTCLSATIAEEAFRPASGANRRFCAPRMLSPCSVALSARLTPQHCPGPLRPARRLPEAKANHNTAGREQTGESKPAKFCIMGDVGHDHHRFHSASTCACL